VDLVSLLAGVEGERGGSEDEPLHQLGDERVSVSSLRICCVRIVAVILEGIREISSTRRKIDEWAMTGLYTSPVANMFERFRICELKADLILVFTPAAALCPTHSAMSILDIKSHGQA